MTRTPHSELRIAMMFSLAMTSQLAPSDASAQQPLLLPPMPAPATNLPEAILPAIEVPYQQTVTLEMPGATRVLSVNPSVIDARLRSPGVIELRGAAFGKTYLHVWSASGRMTRAMKTVQPVVDRPALAQQRRAAEELAKHLTIEYQTRFRTLRRGPSLGNTDRETTTQFDHDLTGRMDIPAGDLAGRVSFRRVNQANTLSSWAASLVNGDLGPLERFDLLVGDTSAGFSDLTLPQGTIRGGQFRFYDLEPYVAEVFHGRRRLGFFSGLSPDVDQEDDVFLSGIRLQERERPLTWELAYATGSGEDRVETQTNQAMEARSWYWPNESVGFGAEAGRTQENAYGYRLKSAFHYPTWSVDTAYRNLSQRYENVLGRSFEQGERGVLVTSSYTPQRAWRLRQRTDIYEDTVFANPAEPDTLNMELDWGADIDLMEHTLWSSSYGRQRLLGRLFPTDSTTIRTSLRQRIGDFPLLARGTVFGEYQFRDLRSVAAPASDFDSHTIRLGLGAPIWEPFYWQANQQWTFLEERLSGNENTPRQTSAGITYFQRFNRLPVSLRGGFNFSTTSNASSANSFLADESRWAWDAGMRYDLSQDTSAFVDTRFLRTQRAVGREYEITLETGVRHLFDTGISWEPSAKLSGIVYQDLNADGTQQPGERGLPRIRVVAAAAREALTDAGGRFYLGTIRGRRITVSVDLSTTPEGYVPTSPSSLEIDVSKPPPTPLFFGFVAQSELRVRVFLDAEGNGQYDANDVPLEGVRIALADGAAVATDRSGWAFFRGISPGAHTVTLTIDDLASGYVPATLLSQTPSVGEGQIALVDFPVKALRSIGGRVYVDRNRNARFDEETVLPDVAVCLDGDRRVKTREDGRFLFKEVPAGLHRVVVNCGERLPGYLPLNATVQTVDFPVQSVQLDSVDFRLGEEALIIQDIVADVLRVRQMSARDRAMVGAFEEAKRTPAPPMKRAQPLPPVRRLPAAVIDITVEVGG